MFLRFAYIEILYIVLPLFFLILFYRFKFYKSPVYMYPLAKILAQNNFVKKSYHKKILSGLRGLSLLLLAFFIARPQWVDKRSSIDVKGIDIVIALDVSGSMCIFDDLKDRRTRIEVAKEEAIRFIEKRTNDQIGIVLFGKEAISRCPLTLDKKFLKEIVEQTSLGIIDQNGTWLGTGLATAINRLKNSKAKSKVVILLTDGEPTPGEKIDSNTAMELAQQFGVKIYTIGIGNERGSFISHPFMGLQTVKACINIKLLKKIANKTGGMFFKANNPRDMRIIYEKIDKLEKTKYKTNLFHQYYEVFLSFMWLIVALIGIEFILRLFVWRGV